MMITDGQLVFESWVYNGEAQLYKGVGVLLGSGTFPDITAIATNCKYTTSGFRLINMSSLYTYLRTTLGNTILVDACFGDVSDVMRPNGTILMSFSKSGATPTVAVSGTPTWGIFTVPHNTTPANGALCSSYTYAQRLYLFTVGTGQDLTLPGNGSVQAGLIIRFVDMSIPLVNLVC